MGYPSIFRDLDARLVASKGYQDMAAPSYVIEMEPEDGRLGVLDLDDEVSTVAFTEFGVENLKELLADRRGA
jgi:hypothetical protein